MHVLILGGSGQTGKLIISEALSRSHTITALVRNAISLNKLQAPSLSVIPGSVQDKSDLSNAFASQIPDAVIIALRSTEEGFMSSVHSNLVSIIKESGLEGTIKVVTMQAFGTGSSNNNMWWPMRMLFNHTSLARGQRDHGMVEEVMRDSGLKWVLPRPVMLSEGEKKEIRDCGDDGDAKGMGIMPSVSRRSVAAFLLDVAEDESGKWVGRTPVIMN